MKKYFKGLFIWQLIGGVFFFLVLAPLLIATYQYEFLTHQPSFLKIVWNIYHVLLRPADIGIFFMDLAILIVGIVFATLFYRYKKRKKGKIPGTSDISKLIENGENGKVEFKSSLRHDYRQVKTDKNLDYQIEKEKKEAELEVAKQRIALDFVIEKQNKEAERLLIESEAIKKSQDILNSSLTDKVIQFKALDITRDLVRSPNAKIIITDGKSPVVLTDK